MTREAMSTTSQPKTLLISIHAPYHRNLDYDSYTNEFLSLAKTLKLEFDNQINMKLRDVDSTYFFTKGRLSDLEIFCRENKFERIVLSEPLSVQQERNLEDMLNATIVDRTRLILDIFEEAATSAEGKAQVEIAYLEFLKSRLAGKGIQYSQQSGAIGVRSGAGETAKEKELRYINSEIANHRKQLKKMSAVRDNQRKQRLRNGEKLICLIGYTNSGKSTILNTLTKSDVLAEDKLFATLDTTTRQFFIRDKKIGVLSDTVGFIQHLSHRLVEAFKSTLSELQYGDLLLHVVDLTDTNWEAHIDVVHDILDDLNVEKNILYVFNKSDKVEDLDDVIGRLMKYRPHVIVSAKTKEGLAPLTTYLEKWKDNESDIKLTPDSSLNNLINL